jgi:hypothetical protein
MKNFILPAVLVLVATLSGCASQISEHEVVRGAAPLARDVVASVDPSLFGKGTFTASNGVVRRTEY